LVASYVRSDDFALGRYMGQLDGRGEAIEAIKTEFGQVPWSPACKSLFSLKTSVAVAVTVDGIRTIRVVP